jgi:type IV pilus assembly protein PilB
MDRSRLGDMLVAAGLIRQEQLVEALKVQQQSGKKLGQLLVEQGHISEEVLLSFLADQKGLEFINIDEYIGDEPSSDLVKLVPQGFMEKHTVFPVRFDTASNTLTVAISDPLNMFIVDDLQLKSGFNVKPVVATYSDIHNHIKKAFTKDEPEAMQKLLDEIGGESHIQLDGGGESTDSLKLAGEEPIVKLANNIIITAVRKKASDIHLEPFEKKCRLRYRIDGVAHEQTSFPPAVYGSIIARLKIMSKLDVTETRKPQDGRIKMVIDGREIDFRVSILPVVYGEKAVLRILDSSSLNLDLTKLGFEGETLEMFNRAIKLPFGLILITGPTGSGKSTTLYSALSTINRPEINIMTIEDPVEYLLAGITQVNVNNDVGLTFASGLRAFLRQSPDIVLVGEIRDSETARIAIQAALTGHLVFSTLHTNDAPTSVTRLHNMGIDPFLISSTLSLVVAQRLVRRICPQCKQPYQMPIEKLRSLGVTDAMAKGQREITLYKGVGCDLCNKGYKGRQGIYEVMEVTDDIRELILQNRSDYEIRQRAVANGMTTLRMAALRKMLAGVTTIEEVLRITVSAESEGTEEKEDQPTMTTEGAAA